MTPAALFLVDDDPRALATVQSQLSRRYGADYQIEAHESTETALDALRQLRERDQLVAVVLADLWMPSMTGIEFLPLVREVYPTAKRALLVDRGDRSASTALVEASALGQIDCYLAKPTHSPDEAFHEVLTELLAEWGKSHAAGRELVRVIGERWSPRCHEARDLLGRYGIPYRFYPSDTEQGQAMLVDLAFHRPSGPVFELPDGKVLVDPSNAEVGDALGGSADSLDDPFDVVVVGAGPAGLAAAVYAASEGLRTLVVEREAIGGQAGTTSRIRNYLGFPRGVSGSGLAVRAFQQARDFGASFHLIRETTRLRPGFPYHVLSLSDGTEVQARAVVVATGVSYRRLGVRSLEDLVGRGVFYSPAVSEAPAMTSQPVHVAGGGNSAGQAAVHLSHYASQVTVLVRGGSLAASMSDYLVREIDATANIDVRYHTEAVGGRGGHRLEELVLRDSVTGVEERVTAGGLFVLIGAHPHTGWLPPEVVRCPHGYLVTGRDVFDEVPVADPPPWPPSVLETSVPGVFAVGDVRHRSIKRIAAAAGEGAMVIALVHQHLSRSPDGRSGSLSAACWARPFGAGARVAAAPLGAVSPSVTNPNPT